MHIYFINLIRFFVFEDNLKEIIFCFSRDNLVSKNINIILWLHPMCWKVREHSDYEIHKPIFETTANILPANVSVCIDIFEYTLFLFYFDHAYIINY